MRKHLRAALLTLLGTSLFSPATLAAAEVEVLHFWTSGGEAKALKVLKDDLATRNVAWKDAPVAGGGGGNAKTVMLTRINSGNAPTAMLMLGQDIIDWSRARMLGNMNDTARAGGWDAVLPDAVKAFTKVDGIYVSVPTNIHRVNMVWANKAAFDKINAPIPQTWEEFNALAGKFRAAGILPLAHGGQPWQDLTLFDSVALGVGGPEFYRKAFVERDSAALKGPVMVQIFTQLRALRGMVDPNFPGRDWNLASAMVMRGEAAMQIMGDWAKGEFTAAGKQPDQDYLCFPTPGSQGSFSYLVNSLSMFRQTNPDRTAGQVALAEAIMLPANQEAFNLAKGSIPARLDVPPTKFDRCAQQTMADFKTAISQNRAVPTVAYGHAATADATASLTDIVTKFFNSQQSAEEAARAAAKALLDS
ncbi:MAG: ABC transporter substrate-binding protein [Elstera sp.]